jgi:hypothetical protein
MHGPIGDSRPLGTGLTGPIATSPRIERLKNPTATAGNGPQGWKRTLSQRRSSCLWFQIVRSRTLYGQFARYQDDGRSLTYQRVILSQLPVTLVTDRIEA